MKLSSVSQLRNSIDSCISSAAYLRAGGLGGLDHALDPLDHRQEVAHDEPQAPEAALERRGERLEARVVEPAVDLEVHDRLAPRRPAGGRHGLDRAVLGPLDAHDGMEHERAPGS